MNEDEIFETTTPSGGGGGNPKKRLLEEKTTTTTTPKSSSSSNKKQKETPPPVIIEEEAYLKFDCMDITKSDEQQSRFVRYVKILPAIIGRENTKQTTSEENNNIISFQSSTVDKEHAKLSFNPDSGHYELHLLNNNSCIVQGKKHQGESGIPLKPKDAVRIGDICFYVCYPETDKPKKSFADLSIEALEAAKVKGISQLNSRQIALYIIQNYVYYNYVNGSSDRLGILSKSCQNAISKCEKIVSVPYPERKVKYKLGTKVIGTSKGRVVEDI